VDDLAEARKVLVTEMGGTLVTIAKDVKLQVEFNPARVAAYRLIGYENRALRAEDFADDRKDAGELGAGHAVTALYEIIPVGVESPVEVRGVDELRYRRPADGAAPADARARPSGELGWVKLRYKTPTGSTSLLLEQPIVASGERPSGDFVFATAVAEFGLLLRESEFRGAGVRRGRVPPRVRGVGGAVSGVGGGGGAVSMCAADPRLTRRGSGRRIGVG
jgi:Ca-activated chloride channel family protein